MSTSEKSAIDPGHPTPATPLSTTWNAILTIAGRDILRFMRDPIRLVFMLVMPLILIGGLAGMLQNSFGQAVSYSLTGFSVAGLLALLLFQSVMSGLTSLIDDRTSDFSQELFIAPISRYAILFGKILGEALVALVQGIVLFVLGVLLFSAPVSLFSVLLLIPVELVIALFGGSFGVLLTSLFRNSQTANIVMPFLLFPQFFLAGVFIPISGLPWYLNAISLIIPMRYAVDLARGIFYAGTADYAQVVLWHPLINLSVIAALFTIFMVVGTVLFVRQERNR
jgi:ABC-2 type transport system permease protein